MSVHRSRPLPTGPAVGRLVVIDAVVHRTRELLLRAGTPTHAHEGMVWWLGRRIGPDTLVLACNQPVCQSGPQFVMADEAAAGATARAARALRLGIVAQVHSHPGSDCRHSDGDDELIFMRYDGMFSLVVGEYGTGGLFPEEGAGLHQFQGQRWVLIRQPTPALLSVPAEVHA